MALPVIFRALFEGVATDAVLKGVKAVMAKMPWAKDQRKVQHVERKIALLVDSASDLARNLVPEAVDAQLDRLLKDFHEDLVQEGISTEDANLVRDSVRAQFRTTVLLPLQDLVRVQRRLEVLEKEGEEATKLLSTINATLDATNRELSRQRTVLVWAVAIGSAVLALAFAATLFALLVNRR